MVQEFSVITSKLPFLSECHKRHIVELLNWSKIDFVVTCTADCTCHHQRNSRKKLIFPGELRNSEQIWEFIAIENAADLDV